MPDQSSAATEHALLQEITAPLMELPDDPVPAVADVEFPVALRGYDRLAVDAYVKRTSQLVAELQATRSPEAAVRRALERVGKEVSSILQRAHETAAQITSQSRGESEDRLEDARAEAVELTAVAERRLKELDAETDRIWAERHRIVEDVRALADRLLGIADTAAERFPAEELDDELESEHKAADEDGVVEQPVTTAEGLADEDEEADAEDEEADGEDDEDDGEDDEADGEATTIMPKLDESEGSLEDEAP